MSKCNSCQVHKFCEEGGCAIYCSLRISMLSSGLVQLYQEYAKTGSESKRLYIIECRENLEMWVGKLEYSRSFLDT